MVANGIIEAQWTIVGTAMAWFFKAFNKYFFYVYVIYGRIMVNDTLSEPLYV